MKLKNKKTGEIVDVYKSKVLIHFDGGKKTRQFKSLDELCKEWEDYEEQKEYWYIDWNGEVCHSDIHDERTNQMELIGNKFETEEEAKEVKEKLKALTRLQKAGFVLHCGDPIFDYQGDHNERLYGMAEFEVANYEGVEKDLQIILGGGE